MNIFRWLIPVFALTSISLSTGMPAALASRPETLDTGTINDVSNYVDFLGNPFYERFRLDRLAYDRNVWDMEVFDGRLYFGHGNSNNVGYGGDPGPIEVWYYDAASQSFGYDQIVDDEQVDQFVVIGDSLFIPGHDSTEPQPNIYRLNADGWVKWDNLSRALHVYDVYSYEGTLYAALGIGGRNNQVIASTSDNGESWMRYRLPTAADEGNDNLNIYRAWQFFEVGSDLLVSIQPPYQISPFRSADGTPGNLYQAVTSPVYRLLKEPRLHFEESPVDFFAGLAHPEVDWIEGRVARPVRFGDSTVYLGVKTVTDHNWTPFGLFAVDGTYNVRVLSPGSDLLPRDILVDQNVVYVLATQALADGTFTITVQTTCDLETWREVLRFKAWTFSRSFALYNGDFYFGQGTEIDPMSRLAGNVVRISADYFTLACP